MRIKLAISTCPNDTFIFDALVNKRIDTGNFTFELVLADIQELNDLALSANADLVKVSYAVYPFISANYQLLTSGSALGKGVGPIVISKKKIYPDELNSARIAIPGAKTTANLLFSIAFPATKEKKVYLFSDIEDVVLSDEVDAGVIIHENRFTYQKKGLRKVIDLGNFWEEQTGLPIPLGGIAVRRHLPESVKLELNRLVKESVKYAFSNPKNSYPFVRAHAQTLEDEVIQKHIELYVNSFSEEIGESGKKSILRLFAKAEEVGFIPSNSLVEPLFVL